MTPFTCAQTLEALHDRAHYAHLDITSNNIMLRHSCPPDEWDDVRLLDLGLAQKCMTGGSSLPHLIPVSDCRPTGCICQCCRIVLLSALMREDYGRAIVDLWLVMVCR